MDEIMPCFEAKPWKRQIMRSRARRVRLGMGARAANNGSHENATDIDVG